MHARVLKLSDGKYAVRFNDPTGAVSKPAANGRTYPVVRTFRVSEYREAAQNVAAMVNRLIDRRHTGQPLPSAAVAWLETIPADWRDMLTGWSLLDPTSTAAGKPLADHIEDFKAHIAADPRKVRRAEDVTRRVRTLTDASKITRITEITAAALETGLTAMTAKGRASNTLLVHRQAMVAFAKWCVREKRLASFPLDGLRRISAATERDRRALDHDEQRWLLTVTGTLPGGEERALVYELVLGTGLRSKEVRSLKAGWFVLGTKPTLRLPPKNEKAKRGHTFTIKPSLATKLTNHLARKAPDAPAFALPHDYDMASMIRADLAEARQRWLEAAGDADERKQRQQSLFLTQKDAEGAVFDFHALRVTFVTNLARAGVSLFQASRLARHTDPRLTARVYAKLGIDDERGALDRLLDPTADPDPDALRATGTTGRDTRAVRTNSVKGPKLSSTDHNMSYDQQADDAQKALVFPAQTDKSDDVSATESRAAARTRTGDLRFTKALLYQLS
jgi:integrase